MHRILGKRGSNGNDDNQMQIKRWKEDERTVSIWNLTAECYAHMAKFMSDVEIDRLAATNRCMRTKMDVDTIWHIRYNNNMQDSYHDPNGKLHTADDWKNYIFWQRSEITFSDNSLFGKSQNKFKLDPHVVGIKKAVVTDCCIFVLDYAGQVHKWDEDDEWKLNVLERVVDIITDASDVGRHRTSLFVLSQSDDLFFARPALREFYRYKKSGIKTRDFERKLRHWYPNGAPKSGDRVDVFRIETNNLRRVFKMTFQQAHRFVSLQVSNRDYLKTNASLTVSDSRGKHINELQLLTVKGRVWSLTVDEPELIRNGGGAQVALKNITSRFDLKGDDDEQLYVDETFNGKFISGLVCKKGNLHLFSDLPEKLREMFPHRILLDTTIGNDQETKRLSTTISVGSRILDVSISGTHMLIIDTYGRLWGVGVNRSGQLGLGHLIDQSNPKLVTLPRGIVRTISVCASASCSVILCEDSDGEIRAFFAGKLPGGNLVGYSLVYEDDDEEESYYSRTRLITGFKEIDVTLSRHTDIVKMTTNQIMFLSRHNIENKSQFIDLPEEWNNLKIEPCRACCNMDPSWDSQNNNEFYNHVSDKSIHWLNERISRCECAIGNHIYRSILMERLTVARHYQRANEDDEIDDWISNFSPDGSQDIDEIIEALGLAHSINNQLPPFSSLY